MNHVFNELTGRRETLKTLLSGTQKETWTTSLANEWGRLAKGIKNRVVGTDTIEFISKSQVPQNNKVTYVNFICDYRPLKTEVWRVRLTVGGDLLPYPYEAASPAASLIETKLIINSTISDASKGARFMGADLKDFPLKIPMKEPEFMKVHKQYFPDENIEEYKLHDKITSDGYIYIKTKRGMYGLKQAARLAYDQLCERLAKEGYTPSLVSPNIWGHETRATKFCLCVDDFGIK